MNSIGKLGLTAALSLFLGFTASASTISVIPDTNIQSIFTLQSASGAVTVDKSALDNNTAFFFSGDQSPTTSEYPLSDLGLVLPWIYKEEANTAGAPASGFDIQFLKNTANQNTGAALTYIGSGFNLASTLPLYFVIKDGAAGHFVFNITGWQGHTIRFEDLYPVGTDLNSQNSGGEVSHAVLFYSNKVPTSVPDGGATAVLLGVGLLGVGYFARRLKATWA